MSEFIGVRHVLKNPSGYTLGCDWIYGFVFGYS